MNTDKLINLIWNVRINSAVGQSTIATMNDDELQEFINKLVGKFNSIKQFTTKCVARFRLTHAIIKINPYVKKLFDEGINNRTFWRIRRAQFMIRKVDPSYPHYFNRWLSDIYNN